jgi:hypothetical protein
MKRKAPPRLIQSTTSVVTKGKPVEDHPPYWHSDDGLSVHPGLSVMGFIFVVVIAICLPFYALTLLVITAAEALKGLPLSYKQTLGSPMFFGSMIGTAVLGAVAVRWAGSGPTVARFSFDEPRQIMTFTELRSMGKPVEITVAYRAIQSITPYLLYSYARSGHYQVSYIGANGKSTERRFGMDIPLEQMEFHATWLRRSIGERMHDVMQLDL